MAKQKTNKKNKVNEEVEVMSPSVMGIDSSKVKAKIANSLSRLSTLSGRSIKNIEIVDYTWNPCEPISHSRISVAIMSSDFSLDGRSYSGKEYFLVKNEDNVLFFVNKAFFTFFFKVYPK